MSTKYYFIQGTKVCFQEAANLVLPALENKQLLTSLISSHIDTYGLFVRLFCWFVLNMENQQFYLYSPGLF